jgi:hypothetical protein
MINAEINEEEGQVEAQKKVDAISSSIDATSSSGSSGTIVDTKNGAVRDGDHSSHFSHPSLAVEHDIFAVSSSPPSISDNVDDEQIMKTNDVHIEVEVEIKEVQIVPKEHVKNLNERIENRALEMLQELSLARYIHLFIYVCMYT